jgi:predicted nuclease of predicted toxin-antitoxin system
MKFLLDQGLPRSAVAYLRETGIGARHVGFLGMHRASDADILDEARQRQEVVATLDADFHSLLALSGATSPSVVRIRIEGLTGEEAAGILASVALVAAVELDIGAAVTVDGRRTRIRALPLKGRTITRSI